MYQQSGGASRGDRKTLSPGENQPNTDIYVNLIYFLTYYIKLCKICNKQKSFDTLFMKELQQKRSWLNNLLNGQ